MLQLSKSLGSEEYPSTAETSFRIEKLIYGISIATIDTLEMKLTKSAIITYLAMWMAKTNGTNIRHRLTT